MNRPNLKDYDMGTGVMALSTRDFCNYVNALEKYCDKLEKALDKTCEELESLDYRIQMMQRPNAYDCDCTQADQWKEWALKDE